LAELNFLLVEIQLAFVDIAFVALGTGYSDLLTIAD